MKNIFKLKIVLFAAAVTVLSGCTRENGAPRRSDEAVAVKIGSRAVIGETIDGVMVNSIRIVAINSNGRVAYNESTIDDGLVYEKNTGLTAPVTGDYIANLYPGTYKFYAVVNEALLEEGAADLAALGLLDTEEDLKGIKVPAGMTEANMVCVGMVEAVIGTTEGDDPVAVITVGGVGLDRLNIPVERVATKFTVVVDNDSAADSFQITGAKFSNVPEYSYLLPTAYDGDLSETTPALTANIGFSAGASAAVVSGYILPEYVLAGGGTPMQLTLTARYTRSGQGAVNVEYPMVLDRFPDENDDESGSTIRNKQYSINVNISGPGEFDYTPTIDYKVEDWYPATTDPGNVDVGGTFSVSYHWETEPETEVVDGQTVYLVRDNGNLTMVFTLTGPEESSVQWMAFLTNTTDFYFDEVNGVRGGLAISGVANENKIIIRPRGEAHSDDVTTDLSIVLTGAAEVPLRFYLPGDEVGTDRIKIRELQ